MVQTSGATQPLREAGQHLGPEKRQQLYSELRRSSMHIGAGRSKLFVDCDERLGIIRQGEEGRAHITKGRQGPDQRRIALDQLILPGWRAKSSILLRFMNEG